MGRQSPAGLSSRPVLAIIGLILAVDALSDDGPPTAPNRLETD